MSSSILQTSRTKKLQRGTLSSLKVPFMMDFSGRLLRRHFFFRREVGGLVGPDHLRQGSGTFTGFKVYCYRTGDPHNSCVGSLDGDSVPNLGLIIGQRVKRREPVYDREWEILYFEYNRNWSSNNTFYKVYCRVETGLRG